jgi:hypothetical protein
MSCDGAASASKDTSLVCYKLQSACPDESKERRELLRFAEEANVNSAKFTAADCFTIDRSVVFGVVSTTATYFIIMIQFNFQK